MNSLDRAALSVIIGLTLILVTVAWIGNPKGLQVELVNEYDASPFGPITLEFSQPVSVAALSKNISLEPQGIQNIEAVTPRRVSIIPANLIEPDEPATLQVNPGDLGANGEVLRSQQSWVISPRSPKIIFMGSRPNLPEIMSVDIDGSPPKQLTYTDGRVYDFAISPNGEQIVYSLINDQGGIDLWLMGRNGQDAHRLLNCGGDRCTTPEFSPEGTRLAYTRETAPIPPDIPRGVPRPWVLDMLNNTDAPIYADPQVIGYGPSWSPDGNLIASWDGMNGGIHVVDLQSGQEKLLPTEGGEVGGWSPDGRQMLFVRYDPVDQGYRSIIYRADFNTGEVGAFLGAGDHDYAYGTPAWSPDGDYIALSLRMQADSPSRSIWLVRPDHLGGPTIGGEPDTTYGFYRWDPSGTALVFQRTILGGKSRDEIAIYRLTTGQVQELAKDGSKPQWVP